MSHWNKILEVKWLPKSYKIWVHCTWSAAKNTQIMEILDGVANYVRPSAKNLVLTFDQDVCFDPKVKKVVQACLYHLKKYGQGWDFHFSHRSGESHPCCYFFPPWLRQLPIHLSRWEINPQPIGGSKCCIWTPNSVQSTCLITLF